MVERAGGGAKEVVQRRVCQRVGCDAQVNKSTAKYCSVGCSSIDPQRLARLRESSRSRRHSLLPLARQLQMPLIGFANPEAVLAALCEGREDAPAGMSRLAV